MQEKSFCAKRYTILVVDDEVHIVSFFKRTFRKEFNVIGISDSQEAIAFIKEHGDEISIILCDQIMPKIKGLDVLKIAKDYASDAVRIMITGYVDTDVLMECINACEAYSYIIKPFDPSDLSQILNQALVHREKLLENKMIVDNLKGLLFGTIGSICEALDEKDKYTIGHSRRVTKYSIMLGQELGLSELQLEKLQFAGLLHDIGKIGTPERILNKPGKLTDEEFDKIKEHPKKGAEILRNIRKLGEIVEWVRCHHERYDGKGYPEMLSGDNIPLCAAILAVADTYDAMTSDRAYRNGLPHEVAVTEIKRCTGTQFNPDVSEAFLRIERKFLETVKHKDNGKEYTVASLLRDSENLARKICN